MCVQLDYGALTELQGEPACVALFWPEEKHDTAMNRLTGPPVDLAGCRARKVPLNPHHATTCAMDPGSFRVTAKAEQWLSEGMERGLFWTKQLEFSC